MNRLSLLLLIGLIVLSCKEKQQEESPETATTDTGEMAYEVKLSLAQWSLNKRYKAENGNPFNFAKDAKELGFEAIEYVTQLYKDQIEELGFEAVVDSLKAENERHGVSCVLIMVDHEGDLADPDVQVRNQAVEDHKKWVDAAAALGGHAVRVNTFGTNDPAQWHDAVVDGLRKLSEYAATKNINVLCENHGWLSSDADKLVAVISEVNMENCGTLPDFGNWCIKRAKGERWGECEEEYADFYKGIELMMPMAKAVSAKSYNFDADGNETKLDYFRMIQIVKDAGYRGYIGVEYEGKEIGEAEGIRATMELIEKAAAATK